MKDLFMRCKDCNGRVEPSKLDKHKYVCKNCNGVYEYKNTKHQTLLEEY